MGRKVDLNQVLVPSTFIYVDPNRTDDYIEEGSYLRPFKSLHGAVSDPNGYTSFFLNPGNYVGDDVTLNNGDSVLHGSGRDSVILNFGVKSGTGSFSGTGFSMGFESTPDQNAPSALSKQGLDLQLSNGGVLLTDLKISYRTVHLATDSIVDKCVFHHNNDFDPCLSVGVGTVRVTSSTFTKSGVKTLVSQYGGSLSINGCSLSGESSVGQYIVTSVSSVANTTLSIKDTSILSTYTTPLGIVYTNAAPASSPNVLETSVVVGQIRTNDVSAVPSYLRVFGSTFGSPIIGTDGISPSTSLLYESSDNIKDDSDLDSGSVSDAVNSLNTSLLALKFTDLTDTPNTIAQSNAYRPFVRGNELPSTVIQTNYTLPLDGGNPGEVLTTNGGSISTWAAAPGGGSTTFVGLTDTPATFGNAGEFFKYTGTASVWSKINLNDIVEFPEGLGGVQGKFLTAGASTTAWESITISDITSFPSNLGNDKQILTSTNGTSVSWTTLSPSITLSGNVSGSGTLTNLGDAFITTTVANDSHNHTTATLTGVSPSITLSGNVSGSGTLTNLGDAFITTTVANDSHNHTVATLPVVDDFISGLIEIPENGTYLITPYSWHKAKYSKFHYKTESGTCSLDVKVNGITVLPSPPVPADSSLRFKDISIVTVYAVGHTIELVVSNSSSPVRLSFTLAYNRTFT